ncbi:DnaC-like protein [Burkholderia phage BcepIL02]|uniref:DnaC-like protein n=1 Tax=Burkholderia phage BcepIL02 TaxID=2886898 RepID=C5IHL4_9CAUD|nr:DnaC-like helicase loader [Burkholderia phage BcepIL02]ACR15014.1 DnaC-like protein [Burkholderia phage BcepIL02]
MRHAADLLDGKINPQTYERASTCEKHGAYTERGGSLTGELHRAMWFGCPQCSREAREQQELEERARQERVRQERIEARLNLSGIPLAFRDRTFDNFVAETDEQRYALDVARSFADNFWTKHLPAGAFLVFGGNPGTGKSHLALAILQHVMRHSTGMYTDAMALIRRVRATWRRDAQQSEEDVLHALGFTVDLLVIDEIGVQRGTDDEQAIVFEIINRRYRDLRPTILLTNLNGAGMKEFLGARTMDRLYERGTTVPFLWESHRRK